jgi:hypothetical protein
VPNYSDLQTRWRWRSTLIYRRKQNSSPKGEAKNMNKLIRSVLPGLLALSLTVGVKSAEAAAGSLDKTFGTAV